MIGLSVCHVSSPTVPCFVTQEKDRGVVGSTSNILNFIVKKTTQAAADSSKGEQTLRFVLGTEAGMVTSIVRGVEKVCYTQTDGHKKDRKERGCSGVGGGLFESKQISGVSPSIYVWCVSLRCSSRRPGVPRSRWR